MVCREWLEARGTAEIYEESEFDHNDSRQYQVLQQRHFDDTKLIVAAAKLKFAQLAQDSEAMEP